MALKAAILPVTAFQQNCTLLWDDVAKQATVVDPGGDVDRILAAIGQLGVEVAQILLTHGHIDHAGGAAELQERLGAQQPALPPIIGPDTRDLFLLEGLQEQGAKYGFNARNVTPDRWLAEGEGIDIGGEAFDIYHCPGHTPGSLVFVNTASRIALVGDVLFNGSVGRTDFPYGDHDALIGSILEKLLPLGDDISFICGHGPGSSFGQERRTNPFLRG